MLRSDGLIAAGAVVAALGLVATVTFFFTETATPEIYTLSLHDALPISGAKVKYRAPTANASVRHVEPGGSADRKSTRLNSSHMSTSYAVFCLKKKTACRSRPDTRLGPTSKLRN